MVDAVNAVLTLEPQECAAAFDRIHAQLCELMGVSRPDRLLLAPSCTSALSVAVADLPWSAGDRVLTSSLEHHAMARPLIKLERERGVLVERSPYRPGQPFDLEWAAAEAERGGVKLVACTAASNVTGELLPHAEIASFANDRSILYLMDAAQTAGVIPLHFDDSGADIITVAGHKGPLATRGIGLLWAAGSVAFASPGAGRSGFPSYCDLGSVNVAAAAGLVHGLKWLAAHPESMPRARALARELAAAVVERDGVALLGGANAPRSTTVAMRIDGLEPADAEAAFARHELIVQAGSHCSPWALDAIGSPEGCIRVSFGAFSSREDLDAVLRCIDALQS